jgi:hypothetical protein
MGFSKTQRGNAAKAISIARVILAVLSAGGVSAQVVLAQADTANIAGNWFDAHISSSRIGIIQNGNEFTFAGGGVAEDGPLVGIAFDVSGEGHIIGNALDLNFSGRFQNGVTGTGHCSGVLRRPDVIAWQCIDNNNNSLKPAWIR